MDGVQTFVVAARPDDPAEEARVLADVERALFAGPPKPLAVGRYRVGRALGSGAFGAVYEGFDPELERPVAIKLVRRSASAAGDPDARMLREAKLLARLSHPNVVAVYDVGTTDVDPSRTQGVQIYIVMELVEGTTLREWLRVHPRSMSEVLDAFTAAGRGLAAAHEKGIVHRDFKPDNVLVGADGRIRVSDFGLARVSTGLPSIDEGTPSSATIEDVSVTATGAFIGTPLYMSPEQHDGDVGDARSDQYAFCVALWESLGGGLPFAGDIETIAAAKRDAPRMPRGIRRDVWSVLARGLSPDPGARHHDLTALLVALDRARARPLRIAAGVTIVAALGAAAWWVPSREPACAPADALVRQLWPSTQRDAISAAPSIVGAIDAWVDRWSAEKERACTAARSDATACLDRQAGELSAIVGLLASGDAAAIEVAPRWAGTLPPLDPCVGDHVPSVASIAPEHESIRAEILAASARVDAGAPAKALEAIDPAVARARDEGAVALHARALVVRHSARARLGEYEQAAADVAAALAEAERAGDEMLAAEVAVVQVLTTGVLQDRVDAGRALVGPARARIEGAGLSATLEPRLVLIEGRIDVLAGDFAAARMRFETVRSMVEARYGTRHLLLASVENNIGVTYEREGDLAEAEAHYEAAVALTAAIAGEGHPDVGTALLNLADLQRRRGDVESAEANLRRTIDLLMKSSGPHADTLPKALSVLASLMRDTGRCAPAIEADRHALELVRHNASPRHRNVVIALVQLARTYVACGGPELALPLLAEAHDIAESSEPLRPFLAKVYVNEGWARRELGQLDAAIAAHERAVELQRAEHDRDHADVAFALAELAADYEGRGDIEAARTRVEEALAIYDRVDAPADSKASAKLTLARVLRDSDPERARTLADEAQRVLDTSPGHADERKELRRLLAELDRR